jgi:hypothetical protein
MENHYGQHSKCSESVYAWDILRFQCNLVCQLLIGPANAALIKWQFPARHDVVIEWDAGEYRLKVLNPLAGPELIDQSLVYPWPC